MTSPHTPGPWLLGKQHKDFSFQLGSKTAGIFHLVPFTSGIKNADANAHLIAAAPDLLEALKAARTLVARDAANAWNKQSYVKEYTTEVLTQLDAAIAKAEGRQP